MENFTEILTDLAMHNDGRQAEVREALNSILNDASGVKFSPKENPVSDAEYMAAVESRDMETAQLFRM